MDDTPSHILWATLQRLEPPQVEEVNCMMTWAATIMTTGLKEMTNDS